MSDARWPALRSDLANLSAYRVPAAPPPVKLDANENPWPLPEEARRLVAEKLSRLEHHRYPDGQSQRLKQLLAERFGGRPGQLLPGVGSDEVIATLIQAFGGDGTTVLVPSPSFVMYAKTSQVHRRAPQEVPLTPEFELDEAAMREALATEPALVFYATPNNPTGNRYDEGLLRRLCEDYPKTLHVIDEAYGLFARQPGEITWRTLGAWVEELPQVVQLQTLSKIGLAGARVGWLRAHPELIAELDKIRQPFHLCMHAQAMAEVFLADLWELVEEQVQQIVSERVRLDTEIRARAGYTPLPSQANFLMVRTERPAMEVRDELWQAGVAVRAFKGDALPHHLRITVGTPSENDALLAKLP